MEEKRGRIMRSEEWGVPGWIVEWTEQRKGPGVRSARSGPARGRTGITPKISMMVVLPSHHHVWNKGGARSCAARTPRSPLRCLFELQKYTGGTHKPKRGNSRPELRKRTLKISCPCAIRRGQFQALRSVVELMTGDKTQLGHSDDQPAVNTAFVYILAKRIFVYFVYKDG